MVAAAPLLQIIPLCPLVETEIPRRLSLAARILFVALVVAAAALKVSVATALLAVVAQWLQARVVARQRPVVTERLVRVMMVVAVPLRALVAVAAVLQKRVLLPRRQRRVMAVQAFPAILPDLSLSMPAAALVVLLWRPLHVASVDLVLVARVAHPPQMPVQDVMELALVAAVQVRRALAVRAAMAW